MDKRDSNPGEKSSVAVATLVLVGTRYETLPEFGGEPLFTEPTERVVLFPLPSEAVRAAVSIVAKAPDVRYAAISTGEFDMSRLREDALGRMRTIASAGEHGQVVVSLAARELARVSLPSEYEFHSVGAVAIPGADMEHLLLVSHPSLQQAKLAAAPRAATRRVTPFFGRTRDLEGLRKQLDLSRLVSLVGPSGIGKSSLIQRLVTELDNDFPDGIGKIDLSSVAQPALVEPTLVRLLEISKLPGEENLEALIAYLRRRRFLLIFDNAEHLLSEVRRIVTALIDACPELAILIGSHRPLRIAGEARYLLDGLDVPSMAEDWRAMQEYEAISLFVDRAQMVDGRFHLTPENAPDVAALCRRLDGIPLAIELAASKTKALSARQILDRLDDRFLLLKDSEGNRPDRQRTLETTVDWGYRHLREEGRVLLRRLSVFSGAFTVDQAAEVCADETLPTETVLAAFEELVDGSMLAASTVPGPEKRFHLTETIRLYARDRLKAANEATKFQARHRAWCVAFAEQSESMLMGRDQLTWLDRLDASYEEIRGTIVWNLGRKGDPALAIRMLLAIHPYFFLRHYLAEGFRLTTKVIKAPTTADVKELSRVLNLASVLASRLADEESAREYAVRSLFAARKTKDISGVARARNSLAFMALDAGRLAKARRHFLMAAEGFRSLNDSGRLLRALINIPVLEANIGLLGDARAHLTEAEALLRHDPEPSVAGYFHQNSAHVCLAERQPLAALRHVQAALMQFHELHESHATATCMRNAAYAYEMLGHMAKAAYFVGAAQALGRSLEQNLLRYEEEAMRGLAWRLSSELGTAAFQDLSFEGANASVEHALAIISTTLDNATK